MSCAVMFSVITFEFEQYFDIAGLHHGKITIQPMYWSICTKNTYLNFSPMEAVTDGETGKSAKFFHTKHQKNPYLVVDLGTVKAIFGVEIWTRRDAFLPKRFVDVTVCFYYLLPA